MHLTVASAVSIAVAAALPGLAMGAGGTYEVVQCDSMNRGVTATLEDAPSYAVKQGCGDAGQDYALKISNTRFAQNGRSGRIRWTTPSPALRIVGLKVQARLRRDRGHVARLRVTDDQGRTLARVASGDNKPTGFRTYEWRSQGERPQQFVAELRCERRGGCKRSEVAKTWLRKVRLRVADYADPRISRTRGSLLRAGWHRGSHRVSVQTIDAGSGVRSVGVTANDAAVSFGIGACEQVIGSAQAAVFAPCTTALESTAVVATDSRPLHDGTNTVSICVRDFARNQACLARVVRVDNTRPKLAFANHQLPADPELVRAAAVDRTSGVRAGGIFYRPVGGGVWRQLDTRHRSGELLARVNSTLDPPGRYEFVARATDAAGNTSVTTRRGNGGPLVLTFPLKSGVRLDARLRGGSRRETVGYGRSSKVSGILRGSGGEPLTDQPLTVTEYFGDGALLDRRVRTVYTNSRGRWKERLPGGPSRSVTAEYAGDPRYLAEKALAGRLRVKAKASLRLSKHRVLEGKRVAFKGRVGHLAARMPPRGKLVEVQVKNGKRWQTVRRPIYTRPNGKFRLRYRFGRFYQSNVRFRFRARVIRERDWPYKAPVSSRVRKLVVKAR